MKIGFDAKRAVSNFTGLGNYSRFVISNLMKYYPDNIYRLFIPKLPEEGKDSDIRKDETIYTLKQTRKPFWRTLGIIKDIEKEGIDIYHGLSNELPFGIKKINAKTIVTIHDLIFLRYPQFYPFIDRIIYNIKAKYACRAADKIIAVSECTKKDIIEYYKIEPSKIEVVYQGCFPIYKEKADNIKKTEVKAKYNLPDNYLLSVGSIEKRKNILLVVKALKQLPDVHFVAIGKRRRYTEEVLRYAAENDLSDRIHVLSNVPLTDLPTIMQSCEIFVYPSLYEGFGIPIVEALNSRVPVIAAKGSCLEESGGPNSIYINPLDENELAHQINRILADNALRKTMIEKGFEYVHRFSDRTCTEAMMKVYKMLHLH